MTDLVLHGMVVIGATLHDDFVLACEKIRGNCYYSHYEDQLLFLEQVPALVEVARVAYQGRDIECSIGLSCRALGHEYIDRALKGSSYDLESMADWLEELIT